MSGKDKFEFGAEGFGEDDLEETSSAADGGPRKQRLGPMAAAVRDAGAADKALRASGRVNEIEMLELAVDMKALRAAKLDVRLIPIGEIVEDYLRRDRQGVDQEGLDELKRSILDEGLGSPIRVDMLDDGRYGLNQGKRRLMAFQQLWAETKEQRFSRIPALVDHASERQSAYRRMVDENLIREDISHAEMAMLAIAYSEESGCSDENAVGQLYGSVSRQRRAHITTFVRVMRGIGDLIRFPREITRDLGLSIGSKIKDEAWLEKIRNALSTTSASTPEAERLAIEAVLKARTSQKTRSHEDEGETFRMLVGPEKKRRVDVSVKGKRITISGIRHGEVDIDRLRAFIEELTSE